MQQSFVTIAPALVSMRNSLGNNFLPITALLHSLALRGPPVSASPALYNSKFHRGMGVGGLVHKGFNFFIVITLISETEHFAVIFLAYKHLHNFQ